MYWTKLLFLFPIELNSNLEKITKERNDLKKMISQQKNELEEKSNSNGNRSKESKSVIGKTIF